MKARATALQVGVAVASVYDADGYLGIQIDAYGEQDSGVPPLPTIAPFGTLARPLDPDADGTGATTLYWHEGDEAHAMLLDDPRHAAVAPQLTNGSVGQLNSRGAFWLLDYETETYTLYIPIDGGSRAHVVTIGYDGNGKEIVELSHANGSAVTMMEDAITMCGPGGNGYHSIDADGQHTFSGNLKLVGGLDVGGTGAMQMVLAPAFQTWAATLAAAIAALPAGAGAAAATAIQAATTAMAAAGFSMAKSAPGTP